MYEADDYVNSDANAVDIGLGDAAAETEASKRKKEMSLSMAERLQIQSEESKFRGETKRLKVTGQGAVKEVRFVPKAARKKIEAEEKARQEEARVKKDDRSGRSRYTAHIKGAFASTFQVSAEHPSLSLFSLTDAESLSLEYERRSNGK